MVIITFYELIASELEAIVQNNISDERVKWHKNLEGLQIISGMQTVYSIFKAYESATWTQQKAMDVYAKISFRLIVSNDERFILKITRSNNMQHSMENSDSSY